MTIKVKFADFQQITRSRSYPAVMMSHDQLRQASIDLIRSLFPPPKSISLVGVTVSNFEMPSRRKDEELPLFQLASTGGSQADAASSLALEGQIW